MSKSLGSLQLSKQRRGDRSDNELDCILHNLHFVIKVHYILGAASFNWMVLLRFIIQLLNIIASACFCSIRFDFLVLQPLLPEAGIYFPVGF